MCFCIDIIAVEINNNVEDYRMDVNTIWNGRGHIPSAIVMTNGMMNVDYVNIEFEVKDIEEEEKHNNQNLAEKQN